MPEPISWNDLPEWAKIDTAEWMRSRTLVVQQMLRRWPPGAIVRARDGVDLITPRPGCLGRVNSYFEDGTLGVIHLDSDDDDPPSPPGAYNQGQCRQDWLELVEYGPMTAADVGAILGLPGGA